MSFKESVMRSNWSSVFFVLAFGLLGAAWRIFPDGIQVNSTIGLGGSTLWASTGTITLTSGCGTGSSIVGTPAAFELTVGTSASNPCLLTMPTTAPRDWVCMVDDRGGFDSTHILAKVTASDQTTVSISNLGIAGGTSQLQNGAIVDGYCHAI